MSSSKKAGSKGFTLVELLVVIGIIALLIAIILPVLSKARAAALRTACLSNVRQLWLGVNLYCDDNRDWYPTKAAAEDGSAYVQYPDDWCYWEQNRDLNSSPIARYLNTTGDALKRVLRCPGDSIENRKALPGISPGQGPYFYSYGINQAIGDNAKPPDWWRTKRAQWIRPAEKILLTEHALPYTPVFSYTGTLTHRHGEARSRKTGLTIGSNASAAFMDGHVQGIDEDFSNDNNQILYNH